MLWAGIFPFFFSKMKFKLHGHVDIRICELNVRKFFLTNGHVFFPPYGYIYSVPCTVDMFISVPQGELGLKKLASSSLINQNLFFIRNFKTNYKVSLFEYKVIVPPL